MKVAGRVGDIEGRVACVTFAEPSMLRGFERKMGLPYPVYGDLERDTYRAFGFGRASRRRVWLDPRVLFLYAKLVARGRRPDRTDQDTLQLGGDVVLDARGRVAWIHRSEGPDDRPPVDAVVRAVRQAA